MVAPLSVACGTGMAISTRSVESADVREKRFRRRREHYRIRRKTNEVRRKAKFLMPPIHSNHHVSALLYMHVHLSAMHGLIVINPHFILISILDQLQLFGLALMMLKHLSIIRYVST